MEQDLFLQKRLLDLSQAANRKGIVTFSSFLNLNELNSFRLMENSLESGFQLSGGYEFAERQMIAFLPDALYYEWTFPISCLKISYANLKFAESISHRDILGALMNLGIARDTLGDIIPSENHYYIFCEEKIAPYLSEHLSRIRHTVVRCEAADGRALIVKRNFETVSGIVSSFRLDNVTALAASVSRSKAVQLIQGQRVFINDREVTSNAYMVKEGERISIRGCGKFIFNGAKGETKKGRIKIELLRFI